MAKRAELARKQQEAKRLADIAARTDHRQEARILAERKRKAEADAMQNMQQSEAMRALLAAQAELSEEVTKTTP